MQINFPAIDGARRKTEMGDIRSFFSKQRGAAAATGRQKKKKESRANARHLAERKDETPEAEVSLAIGTG